MGDSRGGVETDRSFLFGRMPGVPETGSLIPIQNWKCIKMGTFVKGASASLNGKFRLDTCERAPTLKGRQRLRELLPQLNVACIYETVRFSTNELGFGG